jgi:hypothetical protein
VSRDQVSGQNTVPAAEGAPVNIPFTGVDW